MLLNLACCCDFVEENFPSCVLSSVAVLKARLRYFIDSITQMLNIAGKGKSHYFQCLDYYFSCGACSCSLTCFPRLLLENMRSLMDLSLYKILGSLTYDSVLA